MKRVTLAIVLLVASAVAGVAQYPLPFTPSPSAAPKVTAQKLVILGGERQLYAEIESEPWTSPEVAVLIAGPRRTFLFQNVMGKLLVDPLYISIPHRCIAIGIYGEPARLRRGHLTNSTQTVHFEMPVLPKIANGGGRQTYLRGQLAVGYWNGHFRPLTWRFSENTFDFVVAY